MAPRSQQLCFPNPSRRNLHGRHCVPSVYDTLRPVGDRPGARRRPSSSRSWGLRSKTLQTLNGEPAKGLSIYREPSPKEKAEMARTEGTEQLKDITCYVYVVMIWTTIHFAQ
jgi:hypothetical protein